MPSSTEKVDDDLSHRSRLISGVAPVFATSRELERRRNPRNINREDQMDPITMLIAFAAASAVTFLLLLLDRTNWGRSKRAIIYIIIFLALVAVGAYSWFVLKELSIAAAVFLGAWLGQTLAKLLDDFIDHYKQSSYLGKSVQALLAEAGDEPISVDVTHYKRTVLDTVVASSLRKGHEVGTVTDQGKRVTLTVRATKPVADTPAPPATKTGD
jgi:lysylphosphatidylglycerol synthetase-like protein (DUF2156 family)